MACQERCCEVVIRKFSVYFLHCEDKFIDCIFVRKILIDRFENVINVFRDFLLIRIIWYEIESGNV